MAASDFRNCAIDVHAEEINSQGYTVLPDVLPAEQIGHAKVELERTLAHESKVPGSRQNNSYKLAYMLPLKGTIFREIAKLTPMLQLVRAVLGDKCVLSSYNGLSMNPRSADGQALHLDQPYTTNAILTVNVLCALDPFLKENGCTRLVPFSHKGHSQPPFENLENQAIYIEATAGSVIAYSGDLVHAASKNQTDLPRRALHIFYCRDWVQPQFDFSKSLSDQLIQTFSEEELNLYGIKQTTKP